MAYKDKYGITNIIDGQYDNLDISRDTEGNNNELSIAVFLFTPNMEDTINHKHIVLSVEQAVSLRDWLDQFVKEFKNE